MEQLKVKKKAVITLNVMIYLILSFAFLYLQYAYRHQLSPFSLSYLRKSVELFWYALIPLGVGLILLWKHHRLAPLTFNLVVLLVSYKVVEGLFIEFNKIIVIALFFYVVISYFLHQLLTSYFAAAEFNPNYSEQDLFDPLLTKISCEVLVADKKITGFLTNWDEEGCFVKLAQSFDGGNHVTLSLQFQGRTFVQEAEVVAETLERDGIGVKFSNAPKDFNVFHWPEFIELIQELGYEPQRLR